MPSKHTRGVMKGEVPKQKKILLAFTAPSGAGKTTIVRHLLSKYEDLGFSVSATTRAMRPKEEHGKDYYFLSVEDFQKKVKDEEFIEWEEVYTNQFYGSLKSEVERLKGLGKLVLFDIEVKGATNLKKIYGDEALVVFVKPPSFEVLEARLRNRKTEDEASLIKRIGRAKEEMSYQNTFDQVLVNDVLATTFAEAEELIENYLNLESQKG